MKRLAHLWVGLAMCAIASIQYTQSTPLWQRIPGARLLNGLSMGTLETVGNLVESGVMKAHAMTNELVDALDCGKYKDPDACRNVTEIIKSRGFVAEEYDVVTRDGYILNIQRIVNPLVDPSYKAKMKPVILQHGLMSSSVDWVINSLNVRPSKWPVVNSNEMRDNEVIDRYDSEQYSDTSADPVDDQEHPRALGFYLANRGYDVFLANSRGNIYGQRHVSKSSWDPRFWAFTFDEQIEYDLPAVIEFVQKLTGHKKVGYVGHSQGTLMMFGLQSMHPEYADIVEPFVALAPVAYCHHTRSPAKYFAVYTPIFQHVDMWFGSSNAAVRYLAPKVCGPDLIKKDVCGNIVFLGTGFDMDEFDLNRAEAYLTHMPSGTSYKNIAHYGQAILNKNFAHFDHGVVANRIKYGQAHPPDYDLSKIRSKSIVLFTAENDWLAAPEDVALLKSKLTVQPHKVFNLTEQVPKWNHIDFVYGIHAGELVNTHILEVMDEFNKQ